MVNKIIIIIISKYSNNIYHIQIYGLKLELASRSGSQQFSFFFFFNCGWLKILMMSINSLELEEGLIINWVVPDMGGGPLCMAPYPKSLTMIWHHSGLESFNSVPHILDRYFCIFPNIPTLVSQPVWKCNKPLSPTGGDHFFLPCLRFFLDSVENPLPFPRYFHLLPQIVLAPMKIIEVITKNGVNTISLLILFRIT